MTRVNLSKRRFQFPIAALLFLILVIAGSLAGFRAGYHAGYAGGVRERKSERPFPKVYKVPDLVVPNNAEASSANPDYDALIEAITRTVAVESWVEVGGAGEIAVLAIVGLLPSIAGCLAAYAWPRCWAYVTTR